MRVLFWVSILLNVVLLSIGWYAIQKLGGLSYVKHRFDNRGTAGNYQHKADQLARLSINETDIVMLGNSLTEYGQWQELLGDQRIKNRGIAGDVTDNLLKRLAPITAAKPAQLFLLIGINDLYFHSPEVVFPKLRNVIETIRRDSPETHLVIQTLFPVNNDLRRTGIENKAVLTLNQQIKTYAKAQQLDCIDLFPLLVDGTGKLSDAYSLDGLHLNGKAYEIWAKAIQPFLLPQQ